MCAYFFALGDFLVADRSVMAASRLLGAAAACIIPLSFAAGHLLSFAAKHRKSY